MFKVSANHSNGYVRIAKPAASKVEAEAIAERLLGAGYWMNITVEPFTPKKIRVAL